MSSIHNINDALLVTYVFVADFLKKHPKMAQWRASNNDEPDFTDAEVIAIALMQGSLGTACLKKTFQHIAANHADAFPKLCSYQRWIARLHALSPIVGALIRAALSQHRMRGRVYILDSKPIPLCKPVRHGRVRLLSEDGAYFGKNSVGWYFGFKIHVLMHKNGGILNVILTPANTSDKDQDIVFLLASAVEGGLSLADLGYRSKDLRALLKESLGMGLLTPADVPEKHRWFLSHLRERIETTFSELWNRFIDRVFSRSWQGLWNTILLKILHYNLCQANILAQ
jgi:DDE family transposase